MYLPKSTTDIRKLSPFYSYETLKKATNNWTRILGQGAFGTVYHGIMEDGSEVAIKAIQDLPDGGFEEELRTQSMFRHNNLVILMGYHSSNSIKQKFLVYEYLPYGDVANILHKTPQKLPWYARIKILLCTAQGLSHLHSADPKVFHRDIKSANVLLLDLHGNAKVADFGMAIKANRNHLQPQQQQQTANPGFFSRAHLNRKRALDHSNNHHTAASTTNHALPVDQIAGTPGYIDPACQHSGSVSEASEVYSFGRLILEMLSGRPPAVYDRHGHLVYETSLHGDSIERILVCAVDYKHAKWPRDVATLIARLGLDCVSANKRRPPFRQLVMRLRNIYESEYLSRTKFIHSNNENTPEDQNQPPTTPVASSLVAAPSTSGEDWRLRLESAMREKEKMEIELKKVAEAAALREKELLQLLQMKQKEEEERVKEVEKEVKVSERQITRESDMMMEIDEEGGGGISLESFQDALYPFGTRAFGSWSGNDGGEGLIEQLESEIAAYREEDEMLKWHLQQLNL